MLTNFLPIVLIPGFMLDEAMWDDLLVYIDRRQRFIRTSLTKGSTISELADNIVDSLPERFILTGFSMGGYIARAIVDRYPERVAGLILIATSLREDTPEEAQKKRAAAEPSNNSTFGGLSSKAIVRSLHPNRANDKHLISRIKQMGDRLGGKVFRMQSMLVRQNITRHPIHCPTLIIAAKDDRLRTVQESQELQNIITKSELKIIDNSGHMIPLEQPEILANTICTWIKNTFSQSDGFL